MTAIFIKFPGKISFRYVSTGRSFFFVSTLFSRDFPELPPHSKPSQLLNPFRHFKNLSKSLILPKCPLLNDFLHLLLGDNRSLPGQLGVVIPPAGPGTCPGLWVLATGQDQSSQPRHREQLAICKYCFILLALVYRLSHFIPYKVKLKPKAIKQEDTTIMSCVTTVYSEICD